MARFPMHGTTRDLNGAVVQSATVSVYEAGTSTVASIYEESSGGSAVNSVTSDSTTGAFLFYIDDSDYAATQRFKIVMSKTDFTGATYNDVPIINPFSAVTATATELNILDGATLDVTELNYVDGVTSAIQTQIDAKAPSVSPTITGAMTISATLAGAGWPSFSVHKNGTNQTGVVDNTSTKVTWPTEEFDTNSDFASDRFTPTVAGKYLLVCGVLMTSNADQAQFIVELHKNGAVYKTYRARGSGTGDIAASVTAIADANGTTDYFEIYVTQQSGTDKILNGDALLHTYFTGCRVG